MQGKYNTKIEINKIGIEFTKKITAYGGFSLKALFFEKIKLKENETRGLNQKDRFLTSTYEVEVVLSIYFLCALWLIAVFGLI